MTSLRSVGNTAYDKEHRSSADEVTFQALINDPLGGMHVERSEHVVK